MNRGNSNEVKWKYKLYNMSVKESHEEQKNKVPVRNLVLFNGKKDLEQIFNELSSVLAVYRRANS